MLRESVYSLFFCFFFFSSRRRHTRYWRDWSSDVCSSDLGEVRVAAGDLEERLCLQALLPERRPLARPPARDEKGAGGVLAEARAEEGGAAELGDDQILELGRGDEEVLDGRRRVRVGEVERDPIV